MKKLILFIMLILVTSFTSAQQMYTFQGCVTTEDGRALPFVNVFVKQSLSGAMTEDDGTYSFTFKGNGEVVLVASMVGYERKEVQIVLEERTVIDMDIVLIEKVVLLKEAVVMGSSFSDEEEKGVVVKPMDVYTTPGGAADIFQTLKTMPGVTQVSEGAELYVRGGHPNETITMVDGAALYHPMTLESSYGGIFSNLNTGSFENMFFSSGGFSSKYGNVLSGVLDIETKNEPQQTKFTFGISMASTDFNGDVEFIKNTLGLRFYSQKSFTEPIMWMNGQKDRFTSMPTSQNFTGILTAKYSKTGRIKLMGMIASDKQGVEVERAEYNGIFDGKSVTNFFNLRHTDILSENILIKNSLAFHRYKNNWKLGVLDLEKTDDTYRIRTDLEWGISNELRLTSGFEAENREEHYLGTIPGEDYNMRPDAEKTVLDDRANVTRMGGYVELEKLRLFGIDNLFGAAGVRTDYVADISSQWYDVRSSVGYSFNKYTSLRFGWGTFHQMPELRLYAPTDGNPDLKPMQAIHYVVSFDHQISDGHSFRVELYHKDYENLPREVDTDINYDNSGYGFATGADVILKGRLGASFDGWISYGYIHTKRLWKDYEEYAKSDYDITHQVSFIMKYHISAMWEIGMNFKLASGRPYTPVVGSDYIESANVYEPLYASENSGRYPDYKRYDVRLSHYNQIFDYFTVLYVEAMNIFDHNNIFGYTYSNDYSKRSDIRSYFGSRTIVVGMMMNL